MSREYTRRLAQAMLVIASSSDEASQSDNRIVVWRFHEAPQVLQDMSPHGGDEDWLAVVPPALRDEWIPWLERGHFGVCDVSRHPTPDGSMVYIGAHA